MIVIPMAGLSSRFANAGYQLPKYMLKANNKTLFSYSLKSFTNYYETQEFIFIGHDYDGVKDFIDLETKLLGIKNYQIVLLNEQTNGQAETVFKGLASISEDNESPITIFNIDTFRPGFKFPIEFLKADIDGYLEVFKGDGNNWSYVLPDPIIKNKVIKTAEKNPISNLCCTGMYYFNSISLFNHAFDEYKHVALKSMGLKELFVAPMYNILIEQNYNIKYTEIPKNDVIFFGTPPEYEAFLLESFE
jgi:dTDP-glucose pyrophosphorylase